MRAWIAAWWLGMGIHVPTGAQVHVPMGMEIHAPTGVEVYMPTGAQVHVPTGVGVYVPDSRGVHVAAGPGMYGPPSVEAYVPTSVGVQMPADAKMQVPAATGGPAPTASTDAQGARRLSAWRGRMRLPLARRHGPAPDALIAYLIEDNRKQGFPERPRAAEPSADFRRDLLAALNGLPPPVRRALEKKFAGVYLVEGLGSTGWTESLLDEKGAAAAGVIVLDYGVLQKLTANAWASWKENTPFKADARWRLEARIEEPGEDTRRQAIQYILLHEIGHVLAVGTRLHPWSDVAPADARGPYPFMDLSWIVSPGGKYVSRFEAAFSARPRVVYYLGAQLDGARMQETYAQLRRTSFVTLYGATNPYDDFAEAFASYVHTRLMGRPWEVRIFREGKLAGSYGACWEEPRCAAKRAMVEEVLGIRGRTK